MSELESLRTEMNKIQIRGKTEMSEVDLIIHILSNLPEEYEVAVSALERKLKDVSVHLNMEDICETLSSRYERIVKNDKAKREEVAFAAFKKQFNDTKYQAGRENNPEHNRRIKGKCWYCGKNGHKAQDCEKRKADEKDGSTTKERAMRAIEDAADASADWYI